MKTKNILAAFTLLAASLCPTMAQAQSDEAKMNTFIDNLMNKMTLKEKLGQLNLPVTGDIVTGVNSSLVGRHIVIEHAPVAHIHRVVVASCLCTAIECKVLHASHHGVGSCQILSLITLHHGFCDARTEVWILAIAFSHTSPAWVAADIEHRTESPVDTISRAFLCGDLGCTLDGFHIP